MTDIVVTIPKKEMEHVFKDKFDDPYIPDEDELMEYITDEYSGDSSDDDIFESFWNLSSKPKRLTIGDKIWFIFNGKIVASGKVTAIETGSQDCCVTGRNWKGCQVYFNDVDTFWKGPKMRGFQGFRYYTEE